MSITGPQTAQVGDVQSITITGTSQAGQQVTLDGDFSNLGGGVLNSLGVNDVSGISITGDYEFSGDVTIAALTATAAFTDSGAGHIAVGGALSVLWGNDVSLTNVGNDFTGTVSIDAGTISLSDANSIELGTTRATANFTSTSIGAVTQATNTDIVVQGKTTLDSGASDITLDTITNDFQDDVSVTAGNVTLADTTDFSFGNFTTTGDVNVNVRGDISDASGATITTGGQSTIETLFGNIIVDNGTHDFGSVLTTVL